MHAERAARRRGRARPRVPDLVAVVDQHRPGRDRATDPRRRPAHPDPEAAPADGVQLDVGDHRLHRGERRDAPHPGHAPARPQPELRPARTSRSPAEMPKGSVLDLARQPVARRRREHDRRPPHRHRDELLRRATSASRRTSSSACRRQLVKTFAPRLQELVGYGIYTGLIGHIDKQTPAHGAVR